MAPPIEPMPPITTMEKISSDNVRREAVGPQLLLVVGVQRAGHRGHEAGLAANAASLVRTSGTP